MGTYIITLRYFAIGSLTNPMDMGYDATRNPT